MSPSITSTFSIDEDLALALQLNELEDGYPIDDEYYSDKDEDDYTFYDLDGDRNYADIHLAPPPQHKSRRRRFKNKKPQTPKPLLFTKIIQPIIDCPRPLVFPLEVLGLVCSHLSQSTLRTCVSLVCKDWNAVSDQYIRRIGVWTALSEDYQQLLMEQMKRLDTLECWFNMDPAVPGSTSIITQEDTRQRWRAFLDAILLPFDEDLHSNERGIQEPSVLHDRQDKRIPNCLLHNISNLSLRGEYIDYSTAITTIHQQQGFRFLKTFFLEIHRGSRDILLFPLLDDCPNLLELTIRVPHTSTVNILAGDSDDQIPDDIPQPVNPETAHFPVKPKTILPPKIYNQRYNLRVFDIEKCTVKHPILERIVSTCPKLRVLKAREINAQLWRADIGYYAHEIKHDRLLQHAKKMCPDLGWYNVILRQNTATDFDHMKRMNTYFPDTKYLSISSCGYQAIMPDALVSRALFNQITVLEVTPAVSRNVYTAILNKVLCRSPKLLHFIAPKYQFLVSELYSPPEPVTPIPKTFIENIRCRKRQEREERRKHRQEALLRIQNTGSSSVNTNTSSNQEALDASDSKIWQCYDLRSIDIRLDLDDLSSSRFTTYIDRNRLFRNLTNLRLSLNKLMVGQLLEFPHVIKRREKAAEDLQPKRKIGFMNIKAKEKLKMPKRFENDLLHLRGLRSLEHLHIEAQNIPGMIQSSDFEFLRKHSDETVLRTISHEVNDHAQDQDISSNNIEDIGDILEEDDGNGIVSAAYKPKALETETFWPRLQEFHVRCFYHPIATNYSDVVSGVRSIRPGVEFSIKQIFIWL
ncbi:hypothetical protein BGX27_009849 [Mortierella sp. AM989]|nr:hypothetical protein BGX27_009849 [Mortierella sp. AM989]